MRLSPARATSPPLRFYRLGAVRALPWPGHRAEQIRHRRLAGDDRTGWLVGLRHRALSLHTGSPPLWPPELSELRDRARARLATALSHRAASPLPDGVAPSHLGMALLRGFGAGKGAAQLAQLVLDTRVVARHPAGMPPGRDESASKPLPFHFAVAQCTLASHHLPLGPLHPPLHVRRHIRAAAGDRRPSDGRRP